MRKVIAVPGKEVFLGRCGENLAACVEFDISAWIKTYGDGTVQMIHQRNGDKTPYPCVVAQSEDRVVWEITNSDVAIAGRGRAELQYFVGDALVKSETFGTTTERALGAAGETPPEPYQGWVEQVLGAAADAVEAAGGVEAHAIAAAQSATLAATSAENAASCEAVSNAYLQDAKTNAEWAINAADEATAAMREAVAAKDEVLSYIGGSGATVEYVDDKAQKAEANANAYTDKKISEIPAPDMSSKVSKTGDTMTGDLKLKPYGSGYSVVKKNASSGGDYGLQLQDYGDDGSFMGLTISAKEQKLEFKKKAAGASGYTYPSIYSTDNPPAPDEVNAVPIWGGTMTGALTLSGTPYADNHAATKKYVDDLRTELNETISMSVSGYATSADYDITFPYNNWVTDDDDNITNTVEAFEFMVNDRPIADVILGHAGDPDADAAKLDAWGKVMSVKAGDGTITLYASEVPAVSLRVLLKVVK